MPKAVIIGASVGGLVAATTLREQGWEVTLLEKGPSVGGLYAVVHTPFGECELGMHVLYVTPHQQAMLMDLFGETAFIEKQGVDTDLGASFSRGTLHAGSIYPDVRNSPQRDVIEAQIGQHARDDTPVNAAEALRARFGPIAAEQVVAPILEKLWKKPVTALAPGALHCYFDVRRIVLADKASSDALKQDPVLDAVIGNPEQTAPAGSIFHGRRALFLRHGQGDLASKAVDSLRRAGIQVEFGCDVQLLNDVLSFRGRALSEDYDACIVASPLNALDRDLAQGLDQMEMSIFYFKTTVQSRPHPAAYYILCHGPELASSRVVNYPAYNFENIAHLQGIVAVEVLHEPGDAPAVQQVRAELQAVLPELQILDEHAFDRRLRIASPTTHNAQRLDEAVHRVRSASGFEFLYFAGMRTDQGVFFSHHTIGAAYDAALDCSRAQP